MDVREALGQQRLAGELRRHRHVWREVEMAGADGELRYEYRCYNCPAIRDEAKSKAGTSANRLGKDQERRIERVYGPRKVGEFGDAIDLIGRDFMWQSKATRSQPQGTYLLRSDLHGLRPWSYVVEPIAAMCRLRSDLMPLLILSWVRQGVRPLDIIIVRSGDWANLHGPLYATDEYVAMTGAHFLDAHGRDTP